MSRLLRCRRCGGPFVPDRFAPMLGSWRLCLRCRGPLPPPVGVLAPDDAALSPGCPDAAP